MAGVQSSSYCPFLTAQKKARRKPKAAKRLSMIKSRMIVIFVKL